LVGITNAGICVGLGKTKGVREGMAVAVTRGVVVACTTASPGVDVQVGGKEPDAGVAVGMKIVGTGVAGGYGLNWDVGLEKIRHESEATITTPMIIKIDRISHIDVFMMLCPKVE
jgi:hypothetical protein